METGVSKSNPELSDEQKKKRAGRKKKKSRRLDDVLTNTESLVTPHNGEAAPSQEKSTLPDASTNASSKKRSRSKEKKQQVTSRDVVEPAANEDPSTNSMVQQGSQDSCQKSAATKMASSHKRKRKKERDSDTLKEGDVDIHCTIAEFAAACNTQSEAKKSKKKKTKTVEVCDPLASALAASLQSEPVECLENTDKNAGQGVLSNLAAAGEESGFQNLGKSKKKETDENTQVNEGAVAKIARDARSKKQKGKKKKRSSADHKTADMEVCDPSRSTLLATVESGSVECFLDHSNKQDVEICDGNAGQHFAGEAMASKSESSATRDENVLTHNDSLMTCQIGKVDEAAPSEEKKVEENAKSTLEDEVHLSDKSLPTLSAESCRQVSVSCEEPRATLHHIVPVFSTREDSLLDASRNGSSEKRSRSREKRKEVTSCHENMLDEAEIANNEDQVLPHKNPLSNSTILEGSDQHTQESCEQPTATNMTCSQKRKRKKEKDRNTLKEGDVDNHCSKVKIAANYNTISEAGGSKSMSIEKTMSQTQSSKVKKRKKKKTKAVEVCDPLGSTLATCMQSGPTECMENNDLTAGQELMSDLASKRENSATGEENSIQNLGKTENNKADENTEVDEDVLRAGVCDIRKKKQKRKKKKTSSAEHKTADMEVCVPSGNTLLTTAESGSVECLLDRSSRKGMECCDGNARQEFVGEAMTSISENSAAREKSELQNPRKRKEKTEVEDTVFNQDVLGREGFSEVEAKTKKTKKKKKKKEKKRKNSLDEKTDNMEEGEEKNDVSVPRNDEEPKFDREKPEKSLSSPVLRHDDVSQEVASPETRLPPRCSCGGQSTRKLVVLDLNGILADVVQGYTGQFVPDGYVSYRKIFRRPFVASFLEFCFEKFDVGIWSSRRVGLDYMVNVVVRNHARNLLFCFDQHICTVTKFKAQEKSTKPLFLKDLRRVWDRYETCFTCEKRKYDETNTLLIDDSPNKALCNPPYTGIFPWPYQYADREDAALGPDGDLRKYLARLADAENVQKFVEENPFGQTAITEAHGSWEYYSKVIEAHKLNHRDAVRP